jgi:hypothetical protein
MAVSTIELAVSYDGNGSTVTPYPIPFPFLDPSHIYAALSTPVPTDVSKLVGNPNDAPPVFPVAEVTELAATWAGAAVSRVVYCAAFGVGQGYSTTTGSPPELSTSSWTYVGGLFTFTCAGQFTFSFKPILGLKLAIDSGDTVSFILSRTITETATQTPLNAEDFTVTRLADGSGGSLVTAAPIDEDDTLIIFRQVPLTQPTVFQPAGPFPAKSNETALDRLLMICQQLNRRINVLEGVVEPDYVYVPASNSDDSRDTLAWASAAARGAVAPKWTGQLGVQIDDLSIWEAGSAGVGDWVLYTGTWQKEYRVVAPATVVTSGTVYVGTLSKETFVKSVFVSTAEFADSEIEVSLFAGVVALSVTTIPSGERHLISPSLIPTTAIPIGTVITATISNTGYAPGARVGLDVVLECANH